MEALVIRLLRYALDRYRSAMSSNPWRYTPGLDPIPIATLISPLRYDILVRAKFLRLYEENRDEYESDFDCFYRMSLEHEYYVWFTEVVCKRYRPYLLESKKSRLAAFTRRIHETVALYRSYRKQGFYRSSRIVLYSGDIIQSTTTGKISGDRIFAGDGCHRIALMWNDGFRVLKPELYKVKQYRVLSPIDNTSILARSLSLGSNEYYSFLSMAFNGMSFSAKEPFMSYLARNHPHKLHEYEKIIAVDHQELEDQY